MRGAFGRLRSVLCAHFTAFFLFFLALFCLSICSSEGIHVITSLQIPVQHEGQHAYIVIYIRRDHVDR